jgi:aspartate aminotransferase
LSFKLAKRITDSAEKSFGMYDKAVALAATGVDLINLQLGRPHHDTPDLIKDATVRALQSGEVHYSDFQGLKALRCALANKLTRENNIVTGPEGILVTNGLTQAAFAAIMTLINPGDEVILLEPWYPQHIGKIEMAGGRVVRVPLDKEAGFAIRSDWIEEAVTPATRMIVLVNPNNPTGRVYGPAELQALAAVAIRHDLVVFADEVYEKIIFDNARHISIASLPGMAERTVSAFAFTKAYAMDGWRIGYLCAQPELIPSLMKITTTETTHVNSFIQYGALAAIIDGAEALAAMVADDCRQRDFVVARLNAMPGVRCPVPQGSIYAFPRVDSALESKALAIDILEKVGVVVEAGAFYGVTGEHHLRICFGSQPNARLSEAMDRLDSYFTTTTS